jgi:hypothetical protein
MKVQLASSKDKAKISSELKETIQDMEWYISQLRNSCGSLATHTKDLEETYQQLLINTYKSNNKHQITALETFLSNECVASNSDEYYLLKELHELGQAEQEASTVLYNLQNNHTEIHHYDVLESLPYKTLEKSVVMIESYAMENYQELENLLSTSTETRRDLFLNHIKSEKQVTQLVLFHLNFRIV